MFEILGSLCDCWDKLKAGIFFLKKTFISNRIDMLWIMEKFDISAL